MSLITIRLGGVPEHFNLPIHLAKEAGEFASRGVDLQWTTFAGGTGQMTKALRNNEVDACILLTEGITRDILAGNPSQLISGYINTPLIWGVHTGADNVLQHHSQVYEKQYAISRIGSGSHLIAIVDANQQGIQLSPKQFTIINNLEGALDSLSSLETDVFYWEKFTTKPYVDSGQLRRVGSFATPWPCFVIAATNKVLSEHAEAMIRTLRTIHDACDRFMQSDDNIPLVAKRYGLQVPDVERWYHATEWAIHGWISNKMLRGVIHNLKLASLVPEDATTEGLVWER